MQSVVYREGTIRQLPPCDVAYDHFGLCVAKLRFLVNITESCSRVKTDPNRSAKTPIVTIMFLSNPAT